MTRTWRRDYDPDDPVLAEVIAIVGGLPGTHVEETWGVMTLRVGRKLIGMYSGGLDGGARDLIFKPVEAERASLEADPRFRRAPHLTSWLALRLDPPINAAEVRELLTDSFALVAPRELADQVGGRPS